MSYDTLLTLFSAIVWISLDVTIFAFPFLGLVLVWFRWFKYRSSALHPRLELFNNILFTLFDIGFTVGMIISLVRSVPSFLNG